MSKNGFIELIKLIKLISIWVFIDCLLNSKICRGDTPFCSDECRQEQIELDEAKEKNRKMRVLRSKKDSNKSNSSANSTNPSSGKTHSYSLRTGTVAAA